MNKHILTKAILEKSSKPEEILFYIDIAKTENAYTKFEKNKYIIEFSDNSVKSFGMLMDRSRPDLLPKALRQLADKIDNYLNKGD